jgi:hypothetical protein
MRLDLHHEVKDLGKLRAVSLHHIAQRTDGQCLCFS